MDQQKQYGTVLQALATIPDPRHTRGKQLEWSFILGVIVSALLSQQRSVSAIAQWAKQHAAPLVAAFQPAHGRVPSEERGGNHGAGAGPAVLCAPARRGVAIVPRLLRSSAKP